jgi:hypothetical protein
MTNDPNIGSSPFRATVHRSVNWTDGDVYEVRAHSSGQIFAIGHDPLIATARRLRESGCVPGHTIVLAYVDPRPDITSTVGAALAGAKAA